MPQLSHAVSPWKMAIPHSGAYWLLLQMKTLSVTYASIHWGDTDSSIWKMNINPPTLGKTER